MRLITVTIVVVLAIGVTAEGQQADANPSVRRVRAALDVQTPPLKTRSLPAWQEPTFKRFGVVTPLPPDINGEFVRAVVPVGELAMRAGRAVAMLGIVALNALPTVRSHARCATTRRPGNRLRKTYVARLMVSARVIGCQSKILIRQPE